MSDVARANVAAVRAPSSPPPEVAALRAYNIASGEPHTIGEIATALTDAFDGLRPRITREFRADDVRDILASAARAAAELGFTARTTFAVGMQEFAAAPLR